MAVQALDAARLPVDWAKLVQKLALATALFVVAYGVVPAYASGYLVEAILLPFLALSLAAVGLNLLTGYCGQLSLGSSAFMAVGAFGAYNFNLRVEGLPLAVTMILAGISAAGFGVVFGLPSLRLRGFYLAVSTLAAQFFLQWALTKFGWFSNDNPSGVISAPHLAVAGLSLDSATGRYLLSVTTVMVLTALVWRLVNSATGRNFIAVRDNETAARVIGVPVLRTKLLAFAISSFIIGIAGVLWAFTYLRTVEPAGFNLDRSFQILFIIIIGGLASIRGAFLGAAFIVVLPLFLSRLGAFLFGGLFDSGVLDMSQRIVLGALIIIFLIAEPSGLSALFDRLKRRIGSRSS
ncbi:branched-chain amino acid ABC transporter permease [Mesorhizobium sp.]|uniref:branched-chain amino acid ABC transporter permease n=1 Tax=Mesorhizobium sp. TaxID=1871066 RepID=UPI000FE4A530|nr:branched-chain amino acid ABC transporter permease [Mesorhizobium sp.]RWO90810.1 MAG: branched-chain amino acid ABC transporter permease [Mesorhizobium sp.]RWP56329.1 MAG: branched-chain amino acid ABC transporter permease [Mesorhizobium sp.]